MMRFLNAEPSRNRHPRGKQQHGGREQQDRERPLPAPAHRPRDLLHFRRAIRPRAAAAALSRVFNSSASSSRTRAIVGRFKPAPLHEPGDEAAENQEAASAIHTRGNWSGRIQRTSNTATDPADGRGHQPDGPSLQPPAEIDATGKRAGRRLPEAFVVPGAWLNKFSRWR